MMLRLSEKASRPARIPFAVMLVDTGHNFGRVLEIRGQRVAYLKALPIVASAQEAIDAGTVYQPLDGARNQSPVLLDALAKHRSTAVFGRCPS